MVFAGLSHAAPPERIVSLAPAVTEMLYALGLGEKTVAVTTFCDYPPEAKGKPKIGGMSNPSLEAVVSLRPDIVVMTTDGNPKEFHERLESLGLKTYVFRARRISELPGALRELGAALGVKERAEELAAGIEKKLKRPDYKGRRHTALKTLFIVWPEPLIVAGPGTAIDDAIILLGHKNIAGDSMGDEEAWSWGAYPKFSVEEVIRRGPDVIFIGGGHEEMSRVSEKLLMRLKSTPAVKKGNVHYVGDRLYRLGPRVVEGVEELAVILNPESAGKKDGL